MRNNYRFDMQLNTKVSILYDSQAFDIQRYGGVSRYFSSLFEEFDKRQDISYQLPIGTNDNEYLKEMERFSSSKYRRGALWSGKDFKGKKTLLRIADKASSGSSFNKGIKSLQQHAFDLFHPTYYDPYFLKYLGEKPFVLTVHDMIHEKYPMYFKNDRFPDFKKKVIPLATKIITVSAHTKKDLMELYGIAEEKIQIIHLANSLAPILEKPAGVQELPERYILYVGSRSRYKNFQGFIKAIAPLLNEDKTLHVIAAGGYAANNTFSEEELNLFATLGIDENRMHQFSINDTILAWLYKNALCFVFPSLYEGFGIPVLEAFACGCPAILANRSSLPEVGGNAVLYINPDEEEDIRAKIKQVLDNIDLRKELVEKGYERLKAFSWKHTAEQTIELYKTII